MTENPSGLTWTRSSKCEAGHCLVMALDGDRVLVRNSAEPDGPVVAVSVDDWRAFLAGAKDDEFDV